MNQPTIPDRLRQLADWYQAKGLEPGDVVELGANRHETSAHLEFAALLRIYPGRVFEHDSDLHICFVDGGVRVSCVMDHREWREHQECLREIEDSVYSQRHPMQETA